MIEELQDALIEAEKVTKFKKTRKKQKAKRQVLDWDSGTFNNESKASECARVPTVPVNSEILNCIKVVL